MSERSARWRLSPSEVAAGSTEIEGGERDRLFGLAVDLYPGYANYAQRTDGIRTIRMLRLTPAS